MLVLPDEPEPLLEPEGPEELDPLDSFAAGFDSDFEESDFDDSDFSAAAGFASDFSEDFSLPVAAGLLEVSAARESLR